MATVLPEGSGIGKLHQAIKDIGFNHGADLELASVTADYPDVRIQVDNMRIELDRDDLVICERLAEHPRKLTVGDRVLVGMMNSGQLYSIIDRLT
ncbi:hypothetical protein [Cohnella phaseoli]|uniref:DUF2577 family protein n=1 Tax=Cohnella phaseoli TaxID=456490 RepID=A0A3D9KIJ9_9BACL|nr:hypothetical protein [Cohnella phaseoli]RED86209.1 hypothetical protein DFP98_10360 [Cohnella phaseoli]